MIYNGDCLEVMDDLIADGVKVDAIITDPPYGMNFQSSYRKKQYNKIKNDDNIIIIGATNIIENMDKALTRNGRLGKLIEIKNNLTIKEVGKFYKKELSVLLNNDILSDKDFKYLIKNIFKFKGSDIAQVINDLKKYIIIYNEVINKTVIDKIIKKVITLEKPSVGFQTNEN